MNPAPVSADHLRLPCQSVTDCADPQAGDRFLASVLDRCADQLSASGWLTLDLRPLLGDELLAALCAEVQALERGELAREAAVGRGTGRSENREVRRDRIAWLQGVTEAQKHLFDVFELIRDGLNQRLYLGLRRFEAHYAIYRPGDFYRRHIDSFQGRASRAVSLVLYLNHEWQAMDGGELQVYCRDSPEQVCAKVRPSGGHLAVFLSEEIAHEVLPARRTRYSVACWFRQDLAPL